MSLTNDDSKKMLNHILGSLWITHKNIMALRSKHVSENGNNYITEELLDASIDLNRIRKSLFKLSDHSKT